MARETTTRDGGDGSGVGGPPSGPRTLLAMDRLIQHVDKITAIVDRALHAGNLSQILGDEVMPLVESASDRPMPPMAVVKLAVLADCLRVVDITVMADGETTAEEIEHIVEVAYPVASSFSRLRRDYQPYAHPDPASVAGFLERYEKDTGLFGRECPATCWLGMEICRRTALATQDGEILDLYEAMVLDLMDEVAGPGGMGEAERRERAQLEKLIELRRRMADSTAEAAATEDGRIVAFCRSDGQEVFAGVAHSTQVWRRDPTDVESIHGEARQGFERLVGLVGRAEDGAAERRGRILLVLGESGSGKTHLMRVFRNHLHGSMAGFAGYMQMSTRTPDYGRYILNNLIDSLEHPYDPPNVTASGLMCLSNAIAETPSTGRSGGLADDLERLREGDLDPAALDEVISGLVDDILAAPGYSDFDPDVLRALLYLQRREPATNARVHKYLRCEELRERDRRMLGDMPGQRNGDALRMVAELGRLMWAAQRGVLVVLIDQLEEIHIAGDAVERFRNVMAAVRHIADHVSSSLVVVSCLDNLYTALKSHVTRSTLDRIERDPDPVHLASRRSLDEIEAMVAARMRVFYDLEDVRARSDQPIFPFRREQLAALTNLRTRDVLDWCRRYQELCVAAGALVDGPPVLSSGEASATASPTEVALVERAWNDQRTGKSFDPPSSDQELMQLLVWAAGECANDLGPGWSAGARADGDRMVFDIARDTGERETALVGMCNRGAQGGWLGKQIAGLRADAGERRPVAVRSSEFPGNPRTRVARELGQLIAAGGRRVVIEDSEWRAMLAFRAFSAERAESPAYVLWRREMQPLAQLEGLRGLLGAAEVVLRRRVTPEPAAVGRAGEKDREEGGSAATAGASPAKTAASASPSGSPGVAAQVAGASGADRVTVPGIPSLDEPIHVGKTAALNAAPLHIEPRDLVKHTAFLGSTGSGKTTLALAVIEECLARGVSAVIIDRKGDLARYADRSAWQRSGSVSGPGRSRAGRGTAQMALPLASGASPLLSATSPLSSVLQRRLASLVDRVDVRVYTPGEPSGRPLAIPVVPRNMAALSSHERYKVAHHAASALAAMLGYKDNANDRARVGILSKAIELMGQLESEPGSGGGPVGSSAGTGDLSLEQLTELIHCQDPALLNAIGRLDPRHFSKLVDHLETLRITRGHLLVGDHATLDIAELVGPGAGQTRPEASSRPRLSIISTKFLGDLTAVEFWVARLLVELGRWASHHPSPHLQLALFVDEADIYLPAQSKPATKEPMQDLLKRARSAGVAVLLATQSPGDLDYKSRDNIATWFLGRIAEKRALGKMQPLFGECRIDISKKLASQRVGEFVMLRGGDAVFFRAERSLLETRQLGDEEILALSRE